MKVVQTPGSKSISNRVLLLNAICRGKTKINNLADCDDTHYMQKGLAEIQKSQNPKIYTGNAGTTTRFLVSYSVLQNKHIAIYGDKRMNERPLEELARALNKLGAKIETTNGCPPVKIGTQPLVNSTITLPGNISSQYISALILIAPLCPKGLHLKISKKACSKPYIAMTIDIMAKFGLQVKNCGFREFIIKNQAPKPPKNFLVESDASSASYFGAFAALNPKCPILLKNIFNNSIQGDIKFLALLKKMGCTVKKTEEGTIVSGPKKLKSLKSLGVVDMNETPDLVMTFTILAMFTEGKSKITNISNLKIKETNRLLALKNEISKFGIKVKISNSSIEIVGRPELLNSSLTGKIEIETYNDHRIAMCFGILQNRFPKMKIKNPKCVNKSYKNFWLDLKAISSGT